MLANTAEVSATPDQGGSSLCVYQRGDHKYTAAKEGAGVLNITGDLYTSGQKSGTTAVTSDKRTRGQAGTTYFPENLAG